MAGPKLDGAGVQKMKTLEEATNLLHRIHGLVETYALAVSKSQPGAPHSLQQIRRALPPLVGLLKGQFGMISDQVASLNLVASRGANDKMRVRVLREGVGSVRMALDVAVTRVKENHAEKDETSGKVGSVEHS